MLAFLVVVLVAGFILMALLDRGSKRGRSGRSRGGSSRGWSTPAPSVRQYNRDEIAQRWAVIMATSEAGAAGLKSAITEADKLLDQALRQSGLPGETMGERLKAARGRFTDRNIYDGAWRAHKLRNALAHEIGFDLVSSQAKEALRDFERALTVLGAL